MSLVITLVFLAIRAVRDHDRGKIPLQITVNMHGTEARERYGTDAPYLPCVVHDMVLVRTGS